MDISVNRAFTLHATIPFSTSATSNGPSSTPYIIPVLGASSNPWTPQVWPKLNETKFWKSVTGIWFHSYALKTLFLEKL